MNLFTPITAFTPTDTQELLYPYTGPPPMAYGTHTRLVLENVARSYNYNNNPPDVSVKTTRKKLNEFKFDGPGAYYNQSFLLACTHRMCDKYQSELTEACCTLQSIIFHKKYAELSKGRQTWSFIRERNIPAAMALKETVEFLESNLGRKLGHSMGEYNQAIMDMFELEEIRCPKYFMKFNFEGKKRQYKKIVLMKPKEFWDLIATINTMSKSGERGKLRKRSIATPNMLLRGFVKIVEDLSSEILKCLPSSGIPVGGQEKLAKLSSIMGMTSVGETGELSGDEEKWNECLDPDAMRTILTVIMQRSKAPNWAIELIQVPFLFFKGKRAICGPGIAVSNKLKHTKHLQLNSEYLPEDCEQYKFLIPNYCEKTNTLLCRVGMFMGMFNFTSTLVALVTVEGREKDNKHVQSSDDFIHFFEAPNITAIVKHDCPKLYLQFRAMGINISAHKSILIIPSGIGEFNSQYHHKDFVGNIGTELPSITPAGFNPSTDLTMGLRVIRNSLATYQMLLPSGCLALRLLLKAYKHAYMVEGETARKKFLEKLELEGDPVMYQGGTNPYSITTLHLDEIALKSWREDINATYLSKIMNPDNPFSGGSAMLTLKTENKRPVLEEDTTVGSVFKFQFARNRTVLNSQDLTSLEQEKAYATVTTAIESIMPEVLIGITNHTGSVEKALKARLESLIETSELPENTKKELTYFLESEEGDDLEDI